MPIIIPTSEAPQGSEKWFELRLGIPTASEFYRFMDSDFNLKKPKTKAAQESGELNDSVFTYMCEKIAERFSGSPLPSFDSFVTDQGKFNEKMARKWFCLENNCEIQQVSFVKTDDGKAGCSPDGLIGEKSGLELKCPQMHTQARYCLDDVLPQEYVHQIYGSMWVTGASEWHFLSYRDCWPVLHKVVSRDESIMQRIGESVRQFNSLLDQAYDKIKKLPY